MSDNVNNTRELAEAEALIAALCEGRLVDLAARLEELVRRNREVRQLYIRMMHLHAGLHLHNTVLGMRPNAALHRSGQPPQTSRWKLFVSAKKFSAWRIAAVLAFVATSVFALTSPLWWGWKKATPLAALTDAVDAQWDTTQENMPQQLDVGDALPHGPLVLQAGYVHITLGNGVNLVLKGPAHFSVDSLQRVLLEQGKLTADVPHTASGFTVTMPTASVTDLGTTFGVTAYLNGESTVQVLKGKVEARLLDDHGTTKVQSELTEDHAVAINPFLGTVASIPAEPNAYLTDIRRVPVKLALHNTGTGLKSDAADPHWQITAFTLDPAWKSQPARAIDPAAALRAYYAPDRPTDSQWISVPGNPADLPNGCQITFTTTIDLTDIDPTTVRLQLHLLADNGVAEVRLNGQKTNIRFPDSFNTNLPDYFRFHNYTLDSGFVAGKNTLEFVVQNTQGAMGFRADMEGTAIKVIPGAPRPTPAMEVPQ